MKRLRKKKRVEKNKSVLTNTEEKVASCQLPVASWWLVVGGYQRSLVTGHWS
jgi:hypothetical protein